MRTFILGTYYQLLNLLRVKKAVFFTFIFPTFMFLLFTIVWGHGNNIFIKHILTGVIGLTIISDAIFSIGAVISGYYTSGEIKLYKTISYNFNKHLMSLVISRLILLIFSTACLLLLSFLIFSIKLTISEYYYILIGITTGTFIFSIIGIIIAGISRENSHDSNLTNIIFYIMIFLSNCFYPLSESKPLLSKFLVFNPFNMILEILRGDFNAIKIVIWLIPLLFIQQFTYKRLKFKRLK